LKPRSLRSGGSIGPTLADLVVEQRRIRAGRPQTNGHVERLQQTILEECWRPSFARSLVPKLTALERDLKQYLGYYNFDRAHTGRLTKGRLPDEMPRQLPLVRRRRGGPLTRPWFNSGAGFELSL
jgi:transposase InsO family protein